MTLRAYCLYDRNVGPQEGAALVFARLAKDARRLGFPTMSNWFDCEWIDVATDRLDASAEWLAEQEGVDLTGEARVIESPKACRRCELWGTAPLDAEGICEHCRDLEDEP